MNTYKPSFFECVRDAETYNRCVLQFEHENKRKMTDQEKWSLTWQICNESLWERKKLEFESDYRNRPTISTAAGPVQNNQTAVCGTSIANDILTNNIRPSHGRDTNKCSM